MKTQHNHPYDGGFDRKQAGCPRCEETAAKTGVAIHTCAHHGAFGKRDTTCQRCRQLSEGVNVTTATGNRVTHARQQEAIRLRAIREHNCKTAGCGPICTANDW